MKKIIITTAILILCSPAYSAQSGGFPIAPQPLVNTNSDDKVVDILTFEYLTRAVNNIRLNSENLFEGFQKATSRYTQTNVVAAYKDFSNIINSINDKNDFLYVTLAQRLDNIGFFTLSQNALINIKDTELWHQSVVSLKKIYTPAVTLSYDEEIYLARLLTATLYNNSAKETIKTLEKDDKILKKSDYANYILAVSYFENKNYSKAMNAINRAINKAPDCINYLHFKEKIYSQTGNYKSALKIIEQIEKKNISSNYVNELLNNDKLYILVKTSKKDKAKYYSAKLLFQTGEYQKALKEAQSAISMNKKNIEAYILIGDYYIKSNELQKAKEYYQKAYDINQKYAPVLLGMGHYYYMTGDFNKAVEYYQKAYKFDSQNEQILLCLANTLITIKNNDEALNYLKKLLKINQNSDGAYYLLSKITPEMKEQYLRKSISLNPVNVNAWLDLSELKISRNNFKDAQEYLFPVRIIEPENSRYINLKKLIESKNPSNFKSSFYKNEELIHLVF